jgi:cytochrome c
MPRLLIATLASLACALGMLIAPPAVAHEEDAFHALVFSKTNGFRHESIPAGNQAIVDLGAQHGFGVTLTEDGTDFNDANLAQYDVVIFNNTNSRNGAILTAEQRAAFERYIQAGGGYVGIHSASGTEYDWEWYGQLVGSFFKSHPAPAPVTVQVSDQVHPSTAGLPQLWNRSEEPYDFVASPRGNVHVLANFDTKSYAGDTMGADHPISWCQNFDGGRSWYTGLGHFPDAYSSEANFRQHLLGGIEWAAGAAEGDCGATDEERFEKVQLDGNTDDPLQVEIDDNGRVFYVQRGGSVRMYDPERQSTVEIAKLEVLVEHTHGVHGLVLDPDFLNNGFIYLYYSPLNRDTTDISRFTFDEQTDSIDLSSEKVLISLNSQREVNAHEGGGMDFDAQGNLYVSTGDNSSPCCSGFGATDERPGQEYNDAQRSSANTNDLRGKILRVHPEPDGSYTIPEGNLFPPGTAKTRPEIYVMGLRNPYRIAVDQETGWVYWGEVGPDARTDNPDRGPKGYDEFNVARGPGNFGWPHCIGDNLPYRDYDYATGVSGPAYDCAGGPVNDSPNNTGLTKLPPAQGGWISYPYDESPKYPELGTGGRLAVGGPTYHYDETLASETKFPEYYDDTVFIAEWTRNKMFEVKKDSTGGPAILNPFMKNTTFLRPIDMEFGPDGSLYVVEWGSNYGGSGRGDPNTDSGIYKINYVRPGERAPVARASATPTSGQPPLTVEFSSQGSFEPDEGQTLTYAWDFTSDGTVDSTEPNPTHVYTERGDIAARLTVTDSTGLTGVANVPITVGNTAPQVELVEPLDGQVFRFGDEIDYSVRVDDPEDGTSENGDIDCSKVVTQPSLGHDQHGHPLEQYTGCDGTIRSIVDEGHDANDNIFYIVETKYTDEGGDGASALTRGDSAILQPRHKQAEHYTSSEGVQLFPTDEPDNGRMVGQIDHGDNISFEPVNLDGISQLRFRVASGGLGGTIEVRRDAADGPLLGSATVEPTGGWRTFTEVIAEVSDPGGSHELFLVFTRNGGDTSLLNLDWMQFENPLMDPVAEAGADLHELLAAINANRDSLKADQERYLDDKTAALKSLLETASEADPESDEFATAVEDALSRAQAARDWVNVQANGGEMSDGVAGDLRSPLTSMIKHLSETVSRLDDVRATLEADDTVVAGETMQVTTAVTNNSDDAASDVAHSLSAPDGWTVNAVDRTSTRTLAPGATFTTRWEATPPLSAAPGEVQLSSRAEYRLRGNTEVVQPRAEAVELVAAAEVTDIGLDGPVRAGTANPVTVDVVNRRSSEPVEMTVSVGVPDGWSAEDRTVSVPPQSTAQVEIPVTAPGRVPAEGVLAEHTLSATAEAAGLDVAGSPGLSTVVVPDGEEAVLALDGGSETSPVLDGYDRLAPTDAWNPAAGYGWTSTTQTHRDRGAPDALRRDFTLSREPATLRVHVPAGEHTVSLLRGDNSFTASHIVVKEGNDVLVEAGDNLSAGTYAWEQFTLDGGAEGRDVDLQLSNSSGDYWRVLALVVQKR